MLFTEHVQGQTLFNVMSASEAVDALLGLAETAVGSFHRVAGRTQEFVVQEQQGLLQTGANSLDN